MARLALSPSYMIWSRANGFQPFAWVPWGLYRPTPRGTMVIWLDEGPAVSASGLRLLCRPLGPADWPGTEPTCRIRHGRVLPATNYCSRASNDAGLIMRSWQQPRRLAGDHCGHSPSHLD